MTTLPQGFLSEISRYSQLNILSSSLLTEPEVSVRVNRSKTSVPSAYPGTVPWCEDGFYLTERPPFTFDPSLHQGRYYVQDASSMAIAAVIKQLTEGSGPLRYLDACAAPGGKTTAAISTLPEGSVVVANEYDFRRAEILAENLSKWGNPNVVVSRGDTKRFRKLSNSFDIVAVDAPCSGEGMMRKDQQAIDQWSPSLVRQCAEVQREIIDNVWGALRPGGFLIYSTCTFNTLENEQNLSWLVETYEAEPVVIDVLAADQSIVKGIDTSYPCYRFIPGNIRGEGLFIAVVRKPGDASSPQLKYKLSKQGAEIGRKVSKWFNREMVFEVDDEHVYALPSVSAPFMKLVAETLDTILVGVDAATLKGHDIIPTHQLVLNEAYDSGAFPTAVLDYGQAIKYLQRENINLPDGLPKGFVTLMYNGYPLGIVKNLGNRNNSLMPKQWRILSRSIPDECPHVLPFI